MKILYMPMNFGLDMALAAKLAALTIMCAAGTMAQIPPYAEFQYATLTGSGNAVSISQIPVITGTGATKYVNMTLQFTVDYAGNLTVAPGYPQFTIAPMPVVSSFRAGQYVMAGSTQAATIAGPGATLGGATEWSLASTYTYPYTATWHVGPIASSPLAARLQKAGITSTAWSYGIAGGSGEGPTWSTNALIGVSQIGNTITIVSFTDGNGDHSQPVAQITYTLVP